MTNDKLADAFEKGTAWVGSTEDGFEGATNQIIAALRRQPSNNTGNVSGEGGGRISVPVESILDSPKVQRQVEAVREIERQPSSDKVMYALEESVKLQSHYANLLNMHDGGKRIGFKNAAAWLKRLAELAAAEAEGHHE